MDIFSFVLESLSVFFVDDFLEVDVCLDVFLPFFSLKLSVVGIGDDIVNNGTT
jgi:hypothetical protein